MYIRSTLFGEVAAFMHPRYRIVLAQATHLPALPAIERAAAVLLHDHAPLSALTGTTAISELTAAQLEQRLWVALDGDTPVGFALVTMLAANAPHLQEMNVSPAQMRQGVGTALLESVLSWARNTSGMPLTLTTFRDVPFNAPFYARHGFARLEACMWPPAVRSLVAEEHAHGLDRTRRVVMQYRPSD